MTAENPQQLPSSPSGMYFSSTSVSRIWRGRFSETVGCMMHHDAYDVYMCIYVCVSYVYNYIYIHVRVRNPSWGFCAGCITMHHYALKRCQWFEKLDQTSFLLQSGPCSRKPSGHLLHISKGTWNHETKLRPPLNPHPRIHYPLLHP